MRTAVGDFGICTTTQRLPERKRSAFFARPTVSMERKSAHSTTFGTKLSMPLCLADCNIGSLRRTKKTMANCSAAIEKQMGELHGGQGENHAEYYAYREADGLHRVCCGA